MSDLAPETPGAIALELEAEEAARARAFSRSLVPLALLAGAAPFLLGGASWARVLMIAASLVLLSTALWVQRAVRIPGRYAKGTFRALGAICIACFLCFHVYLGFFSSATATVTLGLVFLGAGDDRAFARTALPLAVLALATVSGLIALGVFADPGLVSVERLSPMERLFFVLMIPLVYVVTVLQAVANRTATRRAAHHMHETLREVEQARRRRELLAGREIQGRISPAESSTDRVGLQVAGRSAPAAECGGDWWTSHWLADGRLLVLVGDVSGHGAAPALMTAIVDGACDAAVTLLGERLTCGQLLGLLNDAVRGAGRSALHMTCFAAIVDPARDELRYANAGHCFPYLFHQAGKGGLAVRPLNARGHALGHLDGATYKEERRALRRGDVIALFTDGVYERRDTGGAPYSTRRLRGEIAERLALAPGDLCGHVIDSVERFAGGVQPEDDSTLVIVRFDPTSAQAAVERAG